MSSLVFTGVGSRPLVTAAGSTRWNTSTSTMEVFDGASWQTMSAGERDLTMKEMVEQLEDEIAVTIEQNYADSAAIQDAFKEWEEANERFKIVLALAENKG